PQRARRHQRGFDAVRTPALEHLAYGVAGVALRLEVDRNRVDEGLQLLRAGLAAKQCTLRPGETELAPGTSDHQRPEAPHRATCSGVWLTRRAPGSARRRFRSLPDRAGSRSS